MIAASERPARAAAVATPARSECPAKSPSRPAAAARATTISAPDLTNVGRFEPAVGRPDRTRRFFSSPPNGDRRAGADMKQRAIAYPGARVRVSTQGAAPQAATTGPVGSRGSALDRYDLPSDRPWKDRGQPDAPSTECHPGGRQMLHTDVMDQQYPEWRSLSISLANLLGHNERPQSYPD